MDSNKTEHFLSMCSNFRLRKGKLGVKLIRYFKIMILLSITVFTLSGCESMVVFDPKGPVAKNLSDLIIFSIIVLTGVLIVVYSLFTYIIIKYRDRKGKLNYEPLEEEEGNKVLEIIWTLVPIIIVIVLTVPTVIATYDFEEVPKGYESKEPLIVNVTSADWKWIFSYPEQDIETVNYLNIPEDRPVQFKMTSTGTMNSFWVPALGGQKYNMAGMETNLYLVADQPGSYIGRNTNFNGKGYAKMEFEVLAMTQADFEEWVDDVKNTAPELSKKKYIEIIQPSVLGRMTFNGTHLDWIDHSKKYPELYTDPEDYEIDYSEEGFDNSTSEDVTKGGKE